MGLLPTDICSTLEQCEFGCLVSYNYIWAVTCMLDLITCMNLCNPDIACMWDGKQNGGNYFIIIIYFNNQ